MMNLPRSRPSVAPRSAAFMLIAAIPGLAGCGGDAPAPPAPPAAAVAESIGEVDATPGGPPSTPGGSMGLGTGSAADVPAQRPDLPASANASPAAAPAAASAAAGPVRGGASLPEPRLQVADVYGDAGGLARDAQDPRFGEFRGLTAQNTTLLVDVARARSAMREGRSGADQAYRDADARLAALSDRINQYMAQPRWTERDREILGYLYSLSNEEAIRQVRSGS
jgi:hypothetical protein